MKKVYSYRPPTKNLIYGLLYLAGAMLFGAALLLEPGEVQLLILFSFVLTLAGATALLVQYFRSIKPKQIILEDTSIELPLSWGPVSVTLNYGDIKALSERQTYASLIEIKTDRKTYVIDSSWIKDKQEYAALLLELKNRMLTTNVKKQSML